ncbi:MAG TPA: PfkB family carbohydrate kinase [Candidatus Binataceae bacterium]|nr:PfkB family carbohydrate kinase [Candidatus Binataceae bacterium]
MSIVVVGTVGYDTIESPAGSRHNVLGGSATYFALGAGFFWPVSLVSVVGRDFSSDHRQWLAERNVDLRNLEVREGPSFRWRVRYEATAARRQTLALEPGVFADYQPRLLPDQCRADHLFLAGLAPAMQASVLSQTHSPRIVAAGTIAHWIVDFRAELLRALADLNLLFLNEEEALLLADDSSLLRAGRALLSRGPQVVVITRGEHGLWQFSPDGVFVAPAWPLEQSVDPTGAGDTFAGAYVGYLVRQGKLAPAICRPAAIYASVLASFAVEAFGCERLLSLTWQEIDQRYRDYLALTDQHRPRWTSP